MQSELVREDQSRSPGKPRSPKERLRPERSRTDCPILLSQRLVLRAPHEDDIDALAHLANNAKVATMVSRMPHPYTADDAADFVRRTKAGDDWQVRLRDYQSGQWRIPRLLRDRAAPRRAGPSSSATGWANPIGTKAMHRGLPCARPTWSSAPRDVDQIDARCRVMNVASRRVIQKCGFQFQGQRHGRQRWRSAATFRSNGTGSTARPGFRSEAGEACDERAQPPNARTPAIRRPGPCPVIATARLVLRPHRPSDAEAIAQSLGDFAVTRMLARVPAPYDRQDALDWLVPADLGRHARLGRWRSPPATTCISACVAHRAPARPLAPRLLAEPLLLAARAYERGSLCGARALFAAHAGDDRAFRRLRRQSGVAQAPGKARLPDHRLQRDLCARPQYHGRPYRDPAAARQICAGRTEQKRNRPRQPCLCGGYSSSRVRTRREDDRTPRRRNRSRRPSGCADQAGADEAVVEMHALFVDRRDPPSYSFRAS